jgi:hypothetical protein
VYFEVPRLYRHSCTHATKLGLYISTTQFTFYPFCDRIIVRLMAVGCCYLLPHSSNPCQSIITPIAPLFSIEQTTPLPKPVLEFTHFALSKKQTFSHASQQPRPLINLARKLLVMKPHHQHPGKPRALLSCSLAKH